MEAQNAESATRNAPIQSYLQSFSDDIANADVVQDAGDAKVIWDAAPERNIDENEGLYFVDEQGNYYHQPVENEQHYKVEGYSQVMPRWEEGCQAVGESYVLVVEEICKVEQEDVLSHATQSTIADEFEFKEVDRGDYGSFHSVPDHEKSPIAKPFKKNKGSSLHRCPICVYSTPRRYLLERHQKIHSDEKPFTCSVCERGFRTKPGLVNHVNTHNGTKPYACKNCPTAFTTSGELIRHTRYRHTLEKPHACTECDYASVERAKLLRHIRCHTGERPYQCRHCTYASADTFKLKRHMLTHTGEKPYICQICKMRFTQHNTLKQHKAIHYPTERIVFACELCPTTCGRKTDLRMHVSKQHATDRPLHCNRCGSIFRDNYYYKLHKKSHVGEKSFKCQLCPYASTSSRRLGSHMLTHTKEKPFACSLCESSFRQKQLLRRHENLYHDPEYVPTEPKEKSHCCRECGRRFAHKGNLIRHMAVHEPQPGSGEPSRSSAAVLQALQPRRDQLYGDLPMEDNCVARKSTEREGLMMMEIVEQPGEGGKMQVMLLTPEALARDGETNGKFSLERHLQKDIISTDIKMEIESCFGFDNEETYN